MKTILGELHVEQHGTQGMPAIIGWPSLFCDIRTLRGLADEFAADHHVVLIDGPGHGKSEGPARAFPLEACADAAVEVMDQLGIRKAAWVGSAWGGHVGALAVLRHPERFESFVTMNAPFGAWKGFHRFQNSFLYWGFRLLGRPRWMAKTVARMMLHPSHQEHGAVIVDCMLHSQRASFFAAVRSAMIERQSLLPRLPAIRTPTLFIAGEEDELYPVEKARAEASLIPNVKFHSVAKSAHFSLIESTEVRPLLRTFLAEASRR